MASRVWVCVCVGLALGASVSAQDAPNATPSPGLHARQGGRNPGTGPAMTTGGMPGAGGPQWSNRRGSLLDRRMAAPPGGTAIQSNQGVALNGSSGNGFGNFGPAGITPQQEQAAFDSFRERTLAHAFDVYRPRSIESRLREWSDVTRSAGPPTGTLVASYETSKWNLKVYMSNGLTGFCGYPSPDIHGVIAAGGTTVNDLVFYHEYLQSRFGGANLLSGWRDSCYDPIAPVEGFLAEPATFDSLLAGLDASTQAKIAATLAPASTETDVSRADSAMDLGRPREAVEHYQRHLSANPDDLGAGVRLALALIESGRAAQGIERLHALYVANPALADVSLGVIAEPWGEARLRAIVVKSVSHANRAGSAAAWLTVAALMEAEGRNDLALKMAGRARAAGLDADVSSRLTAMIEAPRP